MMYEEREKLELLNVRCVRVALPRKEAPQT